MKYKIDTFNYDPLHKEYVIEFDGWHFTAKSEKATINKVLRYIKNE